MKILAKNVIEQRKKQAEGMIGQKVETSMSIKALSIDEKNFTAVFVMSTMNKDRHEEIVDQDSWNLEHFKKNPAFFLQHRSNEFPIGKWLEVYLEADPDNPGEQRLVGKAEFRVEFEDAQRAWRHVVEGDMNMVSVGFIPHKVLYDEDEDVFILMECELMECSLVGIGSNRQALIKAKEEKKEEAKKDSIDDAIDEKKNLQDLAQKEFNQRKARDYYKQVTLKNKLIRTLKK